MKKKPVNILHISIILIILSTALIFAANHFVPYMMDDLWYSTLLYSDTPVSSVSDIIKAQIWHWNNWGGRSITHALLQLILMTPEAFADILNTAFVFILSYILIGSSKISGGKECRTLILLPVCAGLLTGLNANWKMSMFWEAGAANYLYITCFIMLFLIPYLKTAESLSSDPDAELKAPAGINILIIPLAVIAGWSNENMGPVCFLLSAFVIFLTKKAGKKIRPWMVEGCVLSLIGSALCIAAPGNMVRSAQIAERGTLWKIFLRCYSQCTALFRYQILTLTVLAAVMIISISVYRIKLKASEKLLLMGALLSWGAMFLSPHYPDRATFGTMCFVISVIISRSLLITEKNKEAAKPLYLGFLIIWAKGMYDLAEFVSIALGWIV